jgi:hypothetical protein
VAGGGVMEFMDGLYAGTLRRCDGEPPAEYVFSHDGILEYYVYQFVRTEYTLDGTRHLYRAAMQ